MAQIWKETFDPATHRLLFLTAIVVVAFGLRSEAIGGAPERRR
jgi:hypothetical protein